MRELHNRLAARIASCMTADRHRLANQLKRLTSAAQPPSADALGQLEAAIERSAARAAQRAALRPAKRDAAAAALPINARREEIAAAIARHQVIIICGETGSGKTTQLPQICLEIGRGVHGVIGCTQPRRIAARTVATRLAHELGTPLGTTVGYQVRFSDRISSDNLIKVMTDGILLAETNSDRWLNAYDTLIIDEAHERSLNIDFLLGYIKRLLSKRPELKLIITSATLDAQRFAQHFQAPVIEVSGRMYPVEVRYRDPNVLREDGEGLQLSAAVLEAVDEVCQLGSSGDVLVFLPGEREIRECSEALRKHHPPHTEILPLYARLSLAEQERVFKRGAARRLVLATNVAETSLTVPGIRYVVDSGLARVNRYSARRKINQLQVERISRAAATQRAGRCGRLENGVCVRLYSEEDFNARAEFTTPEILRTSLAAVILRMEALGLGAIGAFPFVEPPSAKMVEAGYQLLQELGAVDAQRTLTPIGRQLAKLPVDPRIGRMLLAAATMNSLSEVLIIGAALCVQDPRERPMAQRAEAQARHTQFHDERSDFLALLKLWAFFDEALKHKKSNRKLQELCRENFLSYLRLKEWRDVHTQLHALVTEMGMHLNGAPATYEQVHRALLTGLLGNIAMRDPEADHKQPGHVSYLGARESRPFISNDSGLAKKKVRWIMAAEWVETQRLYARGVAGIEPEWVEAAAGELVKRSYSDPHWEKKSAQVVAFEKVTLYGLPIVAKRRVSYARIDPRRAREVFIRAALVGGEFESRAEFLAHNRKLVAEIEDMEQKVRRQDILVDDEAQVAFYDKLLPPQVCSGQSLEAWLRTLGKEAAKPLTMTRADLVREGAGWAAEELFPAQLAHAGVIYPVKYRFVPGDPLDGITITIPVHLVHTAPAARLEWLVPGMLREKVGALIKALPQRLRRNFIPIKETVTEVLEQLPSSGEQPLLPMLAAVLAKRAGTPVVPADFALDSLPPYLFMNIRVIDAQGEELGGGRDLGALRQQFRESAHAVVHDAPRTLERSGIKRWDFGELPVVVDIDPGLGGARPSKALPEARTQAYPALTDRGDSAAIALFETQVAAEQAMRRGVMRLLLIDLSEQLVYLERRLPNLAQMCLRYAALPAAPGQTKPGAAVALDIKQRSAEFKTQLFESVVGEVFLDAARLPRSESAYVRVRDLGRPRFVAAAEQFAKLLDEVLSRHTQILERLRQRDIEVWHHAVDDIRDQLAHLVYAGFVAATPQQHLVELPRFLAAIALRLDRLRAAPQRDEQNTLEIARLWQNYRAFLKRGGGVLTQDQDAVLHEFRWMLEELRVSLFAQELKTAYPVSIKRAAKHLAALSAAL